MTTRVQISGYSQAQSLWLLDLDFACPGSVFHNRDVITSYFSPRFMQALKSFLFFLVSGLQWLHLMHIAYGSISASEMSK